MASKSVQPRINGANPERLTAQQRMFVEELLADESFNATNAARKAGYKNPTVQGSKLLTLKPIRAMVGKALRERIERTQLTADAVLAHLQTALFLDPFELFERNRKGAYEVRDLADIPIEIRRCITKVRTRTKVTDLGTEYTSEIELMSKDAALVNAMKHLGLLAADGNSININVGQDVISTLLAQVEQDRRVIDVAYIESKGV